MKRIEVKFTIGYFDTKVQLQCEPGKHPFYFVEVPDAVNADDMYINAAFCEPPCGQEHLITEPWVAKLACAVHGAHEEHRAFLKFGNESITVAWRG